MTRLAEALAGAAARLAGAGKDEARRDARLLLQHACGIGHAELVAREREPVARDRLAVFEAAVARRLAGEPVHRIIGRRAFHGVELTVTADVLDPRPETEVLVGRVLADFAGTGSAPSFADIGTGSGAIAIALAAALPAARCLASDISAAALAVARANAEAAGVSGRIDFVQADMLAGIAGLFDAIASNPPYIASGEIEALAAEVRLHDPRPALDGGSDGLQAYRALLSQAASRLKPGGRLHVEIGAGQAAAVTALGASTGWRTIDVVADLAGTSRVIVFAPHQRGRRAARFRAD